MTYSGMPEGHTTIGAERFHFRVRNGIGWFPLAMAARKTCRVAGAGVATGACASNPVSFLLRRLSRSNDLESTHGRIKHSSTNHLRLYGQASRAISTG